MWPIIQKFAKPHCTCFQSPQMFTLRKVFPKQQAVENSREQCPCKKRSCLQAHQQNHPKCAECGVAFQNNKALKNHNNEHNSTYSCRFCDYASKSRNDLKIHKSIHMEGFVCKICKYSTKVKQHFKKHQMTHFEGILSTRKPPAPMNQSQTEETVFSCEQCQ